MTHSRLLYAILSASGLTRFVSHMFIYYFIENIMRVFFAIAHPLCRQWVNRVSNGYQSLICVHVYEIACLFIFFLDLLSLP